MSAPFVSLLREARYALPEHIGRRFPVESPEAAARSCARVAATGARVTAGYFALPDERPEAVARMFVATARALRQHDCDALLALKAPPLGFDRGLIATIAAEGVPFVLDALTPAQASSVRDLASGFDCGIALPARWRRTPDDARALRDTPCRVRLVKGEWPDPEGDADAAAAYLDCVRILAGRRAPIGIATHDPVLAEAALALLADCETPVELEQLRGLPRRRTMAVAARRGVPVRYYYPFGPGWWPYALEQALRKPYLPVWAMRDYAGR